MPTYPYACTCGHKEDVIKPISQYDTLEACRVCHQVMQMDYGDPGWAKAGISIFKGEFNHSLGRHIGSKQDIVDACNKIQDETGSRPIELGNEKPKHAPALQKYDVSEARQYASS